MANESKTVTTWTCDMCGIDDTTYMSGRIEGWLKVTLDNGLHSRPYDLCPDCKRRIFDLMGVTLCFEATE